MVNPMFPKKVFISQGFVQNEQGWRRGRDRMVVGFTTTCAISAYHHRHDRMVVGFTTTCAISAYYHSSSEFEPHSWQSKLDTTFMMWYKFVSDLRQVGGFM